MIVYLSIGNSDDKLSQEEWSAFVVYTRSEVAAWATTVHGEWVSHSDSPWQNACWCLEFENEAHANSAKMDAILLRKQYRQDSVAWAVAQTEFI